jgi:hypothetical protein
MLVCGGGLDAGSPMASGGSFVRPLRPGIVEIGLLAGFDGDGRDLSSG